MAPIHIGTAALLVAGITLSAAPSFAQQGDRRNGHEGGRRERVERAQPRGGGESGGRVESQRRAEPRGRIESFRRDDNRSFDNRRNDNRSFENRRNDNRSFDNRRNNNRSFDSRRNNNRSFDNRSFDNRSYSYRPQGRFDSYGRYDNRSYYNRSYGNRSYNYRSYGYRSYGNRSYAFPYGYRPYGYRPGWSLDLYFGRPYANYAYPYDYSSSGYGYYNLAPGRAYGAVRIVDAPRDANVLVDGYYAGVVDDYDGVFQHLNLEAGAHHIEIEAEGYPPIPFDVRVEPGQTVTIRANIG